MSRFMVVATLGLASAACFETPAGLPDPYPGPRRAGERVVLTSEYEVPLCAGTVAELDRHVYEIEAELELEPRADPIDVWLMTQATFAEHCPLYTNGCVTHGDAFLRSHSLRGSARHELAHVLGRYGAPLFGEGLATALGTGDLGTHTFATIDELLADDKLYLDGYTLGGDLVHWMLAEFGPAQVLAFQATLRRSMSADELRAAYLEYFARDLDTDFEAARRRPGDAFSLAQIDCDAAGAPTTNDGRGVVLQASLDCESPRVQNHYGYDNEFGVDPPLGLVEWTFEVTPAQAGYHELRDAPDTVLDIRRCRANLNYRHERTELGPSAWNLDVVEGEPMLLETGRYRVRWSGPLDPDAVLDARITSMCDYAAQDCAAGERCTIWRRCEPAPTSPIPLGDSCNVPGNQDDPCVLGSRCVDDVCAPTCDALNPCPAGLGCSRGRVCVPICELASQDCGHPQLACVTSSEPELGVEGLGVCLPAGNGRDFDACDRFASECAVGWSCEWLNAQPYLELGCETGVESGCCTRLCDPSLDGTDCPDEAPHCDPVADGPTGVCTLS